jgi:glyoxylate reductase
MRQTVFVTRRIPDAGLKLLRADKRVKLVVHPSEKAITPRDLLTGAKSADVILSILTDKIDDKLFAAAPRVKMVANYAVGFDNIDLDAAAKRGVVVTNAPSPDISESVAEHAIALLFTLAHRIVESDTFTRAGKYHGWGPELLLGTDVWKKTLGVVGLGAIGSAVVKRMHDGFGMNILYTSPNPNPELEKQTDAEYRSLDALLKESDFVSLHVPLTKQTHHLIGAKQLRMMKKTAFIINTARGPVIDEKALVSALLARRIAGAGLDVYECEPMIACNPKDIAILRSLPNVVLTPHTASATVETRQTMSRVAAENILAFLDGKTPPNAVKPL